MKSVLKKIKNKINILFKSIFSFFITHENFNLPRKEYSVTNDIWIHKTVKFINKRNIIIGKKTEIKDYCIIQVAPDDTIEIGEFCQLNPFTVIYGGNVCIGNNVMIAPHCMIASGNHDFKQLETAMRFAGHFTKGPIIIEDDVWIGANVTITDGVNIGKGAVIAANSCVVGNVEPYDIFGGVPAKKIGSRLTYR